MEKGKYGQGELMTNTAWYMKFLKKEIKILTAFGHYDDK